LKFLFGFATKFLFRMILPGALLAAALMPALGAGTALLAVPWRPEYLYVGAAIILGWIVLLADMPIYMLFEGRRFWPRTVHRWARKREAARLEKHLRLSAELMAGPNPEPLKALEHDIEIGHFPLDEKQQPEAQWPTRLGNLVMAFEQYPELKYGLDSVFFWHRIWISLDKDLRAELDDQQAVVDSALYVTLGLIVSGLLCLAYALVEAASPDALPMLPDWWILVVLSAASWLAARLIYRVSLYAQAQYGELFKAVFDQFRMKLDFSDLIEDLIRHEGNFRLRRAPYRTKNRIVWQFLRWHMHPRQDAPSSRVVEDW
jgi:hypothetical protein